MPRLVVVSNSVPSSSMAGPPGTVTAALQAALQSDGGIWFGWDGKLSPVPRSPTFSKPAGSGFSLATIPLTPKEYHGYYEQHANRALWPLLHSRIDLAAFDYESHLLYRQVNRRFAASLEPLLGDNDIIWIHDYHLIPLAAELRRRGVMAPIGFFLHAPFPSADILAALPWRDALVDDLSAYDLVGLQTANCLRNFDDFVERHSARSRRTPANRFPTAGHYPVGIDTRQFAALAAAPAAERWRERFHDCMEGQTWVAGAERLDYTKGLVERFYAIEALFEQSPKLIGKLTLMQVAAPSRQSLSEYRSLQRRLEKLSGRINARLGGLDWMPIHYLNRTSSQDQLAALFRVSRIGLVTPLRDGMNLVAKEYVAAQDAADPGVLVLSRFAGAAEELTASLLVNPYDKYEVARALRHAMDMPLDERRNRWQRMMGHLQRCDVHRWLQRFLGDLADTHKSLAPTAAAVA